MSNHKIRRSFALDAAAVLSDLLEGIQPETVTGAVLFLAPDLDCLTVTTAINPLFPYIGCTVHSTYSHEHNNKKHNQTASMLLFIGDQKQQAGLIETFAPGTRLFAFSLNDDNIEQYIQRYPMLGGVASENYASDQPAIWTNHQYLTSGTVAMCLPPHPVSLQVGKGWSVVDKQSYKVTRASGNKLFELNGQPVRSVYEQYIEVEQLIPSYPLMVESTGQTVAAIRYQHTPDGECLVMSRPIAVDENVRFSAASRTEILHETHDSALRSYVENERYPRSFGLCISCTSRAWLLSDMEHMEFNYIQKFSGEQGSDNILVYLNGEFEPTPTGTRYHNHSAVLAAFYSVDCDLISEI